jgi:DNA-directed RNA polymerase specialized sigma24 family protein
MKSYVKVTDEELIALYQEGDDDAFTRLFKRYQSTLRYHAYKAAKRYPTFYEDEFFGFFQEHFYKIVKKFDLSRGVYFAKYFDVIVPKWAYYYVRDKIQKRQLDEDGKKVKVDGPTNYDKHKVLPHDLDTLQLKDGMYTVGHQQDVEDTDLFRFLEEKDSVYAKVISLHVQGYSYDEIGALLGEDRSLEGRKAWTKRMMGSIREETVRFYHVSDSVDELSAVYDSKKIG